MAADNETTTVGQSYRHRNRQAESQHPDVVHGPDAQAHGGCPACEPRESRFAARGGYAPGQIERCIRSANGDDDGKATKR